MGLKPSLKQASDLAPEIQIKRSKSETLMRVDLVGIVLKDLLSHAQKLSLCVAHVAHDIIVRFISVM